MNQKLFLGGKISLVFDQIFNIKKLHNYQYYIAAINMIEQSFIKSSNSNIQNNDNNFMIDANIFEAFKKCIYNQTQEAHCIPSQIDHYLNRWCVSENH